LVGRPTFGFAFSGLRRLTLCSSFTLNLCDNESFPDLFKCYVVILFLRSNGTRLLSLISVQAFNLELQSVMVNGLGALTSQPTLMTVLLTLKTIIRAAAVGSD
jgi:hypothetical protein